MLSRQKADRNELADVCSKKGRRSSAVQFRGSAYATRPDILHATLGKPVISLQLLTQTAGFTRVSAWT